MTGTEEFADTVTDTDAFIVFWKDAPGQQVSTVVGVDGDPVYRDADYVRTNDIEVLDTATAVFSALQRADGTRYATTANIARHTLGWNV